MRVIFRLQSNLGPLRMNLKLNPQVQVGASMDFFDFIILAVQLDDDCIILILEREGAFGESLPLPEPKRVTFVLPIGFHAMRAQRGYLLGSDPSVPLSLIDKHANNPAERLFQRCKQF